MRKDKSCRGISGASLRKGIPFEILERRPRIGYSGAAPFSADSSNACRFYANNSERLMQFGVMFAGTFFRYYPWRYCDPSMAIPVDFVSSMLKAEFGIDVKRAEIMDWKERDFLPKTNDKTLPLFAKDRIILIKECRKRFHYTDSQIRSIALYEDSLMQHLSSTRFSEFSYNMCDRLNVAASESRGKKPPSKNLSQRESAKGNSPKEEAVRHEVVEDLLNHVKSRGDEFWELRERPRIEDILEEKVDLGVLSQKEQEDAVLGVEWRAISVEMAREDIVMFVRETLLQGYSPQINFKRQEYLQPETIREDKIDWSRTLKSVENLEVGFVRTPAVMVGDDKGEIMIRIMKPEVVTSKEMDEIVQKVYTRIRHKVVKGMRPWGDVSGSRAHYAERDRKLREHFKKIRPSARSAATAFKRLQEQMQQEGYSVVSVDRLKRIVYGKE